VGWLELSVGVVGCRRYEPGVLIGADEHFPVAVMHESMVESAEEDEVVHVGGATICPMPDVVECINGCSMRNDGASKPIAVHKDWRTGTCRWYMLRGMTYCTRVPW
jgi:hypothetical protein